MPNSIIRYCNEDIGRHDVICTCAEGPAALICQGDSMQNLHHRQPYFLHHHEELPLSMQKPTMSLVAPCRQSQQVCVPLNKKSKRDSEACACPNRLGAFLFMAMKFEPSCQAQQGCLTADN